MRDPSWSESIDLHELYFKLQVPPLNALYTKTNKQTSYLTMEPLLTSWYTNTLINMYMFSEHKEKEQVRIHNILQNAYAIG